MGKPTLDMSKLAKMLIESDEYWEEEGLPVPSAQERAALLKTFAEKQP